MRGNGVGEGTCRHQEGGRCRKNGENMDYSLMRCTNKPLPLVNRAILT